MKKIFFVLLMLPFFAIAQPPSGTYTPISGGFNWGRGYFRAFNLPLISTPALAPNQYNAYGAMVAVNTPGLAGIYYYNGADWLKLADTAYTGFASSLTSLGSGFKVLTSGIKSLLPSNGLTGDSATAGQVGIGLGGPLVRHTRISAANFSFVIDSLGDASRFISRPRTLQERGFKIVSTNGTDSSLSYVSGDLTTGARRVLLQANNTATTNQAYLNLRAGSVTDIQLNVIGALQKESIVGMDSAAVHMYRRHPGLVYPGAISIHDDSLAIWAGINRESQSVWYSSGGNGSADQWAKDSLTWRTLGRESSFTLHKDSMVFWQDDGNYVIYGLNKVTDSTGLDLMAWDRASWQWVRLPSDLVGGGGSTTPTWDATLAAGSTLTASRTGTHSGFDFQLYAQNGTKQQLIRRLTDSTVGMYLRNNSSADLAYFTLTGTDTSAHITGGGISRGTGLKLNSSGALLTPALGVFIIDSLVSGIIDTSNYKPRARHITTGQEVQMNSWAQISGGGGSSGWGLTPLNTIADGDRFGTANNRSIQMWTNGTWKAKLDSIGVFAVGVDPSSDFISTYGDLRGVFFQGLAVDYGGLKAYMRARASADAELILRNGAAAVKVQLNSSGDSYLTGGNVGIGTASPSEVLHVTGNVKFSGTLIPDKTITPGGTTGNQTIDKPAGTVNFATGTSTLTVTNSLVTTSSLVFAVIRTNDAAATIKNVVPGTGSFVITLNAATGAETSVGFFVVN